LHAKKKPSRVGRVSKFATKKARKGGPFRGGVRQRAFTSRKRSQRRKERSGEKEKKKSAEKTGGLSIKRRSLGRRKRETTVPQEDLFYGVITNRPRQGKEKRGEKKGTKNIPETGKKKKQRRGGVRKHRATSPTKPIKNPGKREGEGVNARKKQGKNMPKKLMRGP